MIFLRNISVDIFFDMASSTIIPIPFACVAPAIPTATPNVFETHMLELLHKYNRSLDIHEGTVLCSLPVSFVSRDIALPPPLESLPPELRGHIAEIYYGALASKWSLSYGYEAEDTEWKFPHLPFSPDQFAFPFYTNATITRKGGTMRFQITRTHVAIYLGFANIAIVISSHEALASILMAKTYMDFAKAMFTLVTYGGGFVYSYRSSAHIQSETGIFMQMVCLGEEKHLMTEINEIARYINFVLVPFFAKQSLDIFNDLSNAEVGYVGSP